MNENTLKGITHAGVFHADDVFSTALLKIVYPDIIISRVFKAPEAPAPTEIVYDIGFGRFDHHQKDVEVRESGIKYAAFGLLWRHFGPKLLSASNVERFDKLFVQAIDDSDNGGKVNPMTAAISSFIPNWDDRDQDMEVAFLNAVVFAQNILEREIQWLRSTERAAEKVQKALDNSDGEIVILDQFVPWQDVLIPSSAKFVVFPSLRGGYSAQAIPTTLNSRDQKVPFPEAWAGADEETLSGILSGLTFCHNGRFMITADSVDTAVEACKIALD